MTALPRVSIVIPVYNGSNYLSEAIDSALAQTYPNTEVLVINDGSNDQGKTESILKSYGVRIQYVNKPNGGCASALNQGIKQMTGQYFSWLSHDDVYYPNKIQSQMAYLDECESKDVILYGGYELLDERSHLIGTVRLESMYSIEKLSIPLFPVLRGLIHGCSLLIPRHCFDTVGLFDENLKTTHDYALWFQMFRKYGVRFLRDILIRSRVHPQQATHRIPSHLEECNQLWIKFLDSVTHEEMCAMEGTAYLFYIRTADFLNGTPYRAAHERSQRLAQEALREKKISIIIPFYNRVEWTREAVHSAVTQTHENVEIILVDDGSTENVSDVKELCNSDPRIRYEFQNHGGASAARNRGIELATGDYIAFLDSDDVFYPDKLKRQLGLMETNQSKFSHTSYERIGADGSTAEIVNSGYLSGNLFLKPISNCPIATPTVMIAKDLLIRKRFREDFAYGEDVCLWMEVAENHEVLGIEECLTKVRVGESTCAVNTDKQRIGVINILFFLINHPAFSKQHEHIHRLIITLANLYGIQPQHQLLQSQLNEAHQNNQALQSQLNEGHRNNQALQSHLNEAHRSASGLQSELEKTHRTVSWRVTAPLRAGRKALDFLVARFQNPPRSSSMSEQPKAGKGGADGGG